MSEFIIDSDVKADWALEKIREHSANIAEAEKRRDDFIAEYQARIDAAKKNCEEDCAADICAIDHLKDLLRDYALANMPKGKRTMKFPQGSISFKKCQPRFYLSDGSEPSSGNELLAESIKDSHPDFVSTVLTADWASFKKTLKFDENGEVYDANGEIIKCLHAETRADKFVVKAGEVNWYD